MILCQVEQGSAEWHRARAGAITGSKIKLIRDRLKSGPTKGQFSSKAMDYAFRLAVERISGEPMDEDEYAPWQGERGIRLEPEARMEHEMEAGVVVQPVGFIKTEDGRFGASADGLIDEDGGAEYKCFLAPSKVRSILLDGDIDEVRDQCQFNMAISGRAWWHFGLYVPALRSINRHFTLFTIRRDDDFIDDLMWPDLIAFDKVVDEFARKLRGGSADVAPPEPDMHAPWKLPKMAESTEGVA